MNNEHAKHAFVVWISLVVSVLALVLAWSSFNRTGENLGPEISEELSNTIESIENRISELELNNIPDQI